jgi:hypothetical protein
MSTNSAGRARQETLCAWTMYNNDERGIVQRVQETIEMMCYKERKKVMDEDSE